MSTEKTLETEVIIVGGGPAGVSCAFTLGKLGIETLLVDRKPRDKIGDKTCGDALAPEFTQKANEWIGLPLPRDDNGELQEYCDKAVLVGKSDDNYLHLGSVSATVDRLLYGQALLNAADNFKTVKVMDQTKVMQTIVEDGYLKGLYVYNRNDGKIKIKANITIDCSGSSGVVRGRLPDQMCEKFPKKIPRNQMIVAYREIIRLPEEHNYRKGLYLTYEPELLMPGYYWVFSRGPKELNIGLGWLLEEENRGANIKSINKEIRERKFPNAEILRSDGDQIPSRLPLPSCVNNGFITAGDAAALANPLNGEGHGPALISGIKSGEIIAEAIEKGDYSEEQLWKYNKWIWHQYGVEFSWGIAIVKWVKKYGIDNFDWLMSTGVLQEDDVITMVNNPDEDIGILKRALRGFYKPKVLWGLRKAMKHAKEIQQHSKNYPDYSEEAFQKWYKKLQELENYQI